MEIQSVASRRLLKFWRPQCIPCKYLVPVVEEALSNGFSNIELIDINVDEDPDCAIEYRVRSVPTLILLEDGQEIKRISCALNISELKEFLSC